MNLFYTPRVCKILSLARWGISLFYIAFLIYGVVCACLYDAIFAVIFILAAGGLTVACLSFWIRRILQGRVTPSAEITSYILLIFASVLTFYVTKNLEPGPYVNEVIFCFSFSFISILLLIFFFLGTDFFYRIKTKRNINNTSARNNPALVSYASVGFGPEHYWRMILNIRQRKTPTQRKSKKRKLKITVWIGGILTIISIIYMIWDPAGRKRNERTHIIIVRAAIHEYEEKHSQMPNSIYEALLEFVKTPENAQRILLYKGSTNEVRFYDGSGGWVYNPEKRILGYNTRKPKNNREYIPKRQNLSTESK